MLCVGQQLGVSAFRRNARLFGEFLCHSSGLPLKTIKTVVVGWSFTREICVPYIFFWSTNALCAARLLKASFVALKAYLVGDYLLVGLEFSLQFLQLFRGECRPRTLIFRVFVFSFDFA